MPALKRVIKDKHHNILCLLNQRIQVLAISRNSIAYLGRKCISSAGFFHLGDALAGQLVGPLIQSIPGMPRHFNENYLV
jgi:hypothetical protein